VGVPAILDIDGTLVDTNYHHALAWQRALHEHGVSVPAWRIHRHIGMGGDQIVTALAGDDFERRAGDAVRETEGQRYAELIGEVELLPGARELVVALRERGHTVVLASSAKSDEVDVYLDLLDARDVVDGWTTSADVEATKPEPDLVLAALEKAGDRDGAVMLGDSVWDFEAAGRAGIEAIGVLSGGFAERELLDAGAVAVYGTAADVLGDLDATPFGAAARGAGST
jgi:HAD superfamily hydrolase (TIGR01549 family)